MLIYQVLFFNEGKLIPVSVSDKHTLNHILFPWIKERYDFKCLMLRYGELGYERCIEMPFSDYVKENQLC